MPLFRLLGLCLLCSSCYTLEQAIRFNNTYNGRVPVDVALDDEHVDPEIRKKLGLSREILGYAQAQGLNVGDAYAYVILQTEGAVSYSVQAAYADRLELLSWWFPFAGRVPYLGYFDKSKREARAAEFKAEGYDVSLGTVGAFSSLGWFSDPLYVSMTKRSDAEFVQLLFHELVHRSYWSKGSVAFNENLAEFVSFRLSELFLKGRGQDQQWIELQDELQAKAIYRAWLGRMKTALEKLYQRSDLTREEKLAQKQEIIAAHQAEALPELKDPAYEAARKRPWNNASILASSLYLPDTERFERAFACVQTPTLGGFLAALRDAERTAEKAEEALDSLCSPSYQVHKGTKNVD